jgi:hypothetical protein
MNLSLKGKLLLLVSIPLAGATIFSGIGLVSLIRDDLDLRFITREVSLAADLGRVRDAALAEQRDSWDLYRDAIAAANFREHVDATNAAATTLRRHLANLNVARSYGRDTDTAVSAVLSALDQLNEARGFFSNAKRSEDPYNLEAVRMRARYIALSDQTVGAINRLNLSIDVVSIRARADGLVWFGKLAQAAEQERIEVEHAYDQPLPTIASLIRMQFATNDRQRAESNLTLMAPREQLDFWTDFLAEPVYARVPTLLTDLFDQSSLKSLPLKPEFHDEWTTVTHKRSALLDTIQPKLIGEAQQFIATRRGQIESKLAKSLVVFLAVVLASAALAVFFIHRIHKQLRLAFRRLDDGMRAIAESIAGLRAGAERLSQGASREAEGLERTNASLTSLTSGNELIVGTAQKTVDHMSQTVTLVANSRQAMQSVTKTMAEITESSDATFRIVKTIDEIAFKTNLLAFNSSIEAATAGEAGSGFAVVAEEVRQLAKRASEATAETGRLVEDAHAAIGSGATMNAEVEQSLGDVDANARRAGDLMQNIYTASRQMLQGMQQLSTGNRSMETVTQQNAAIADHNASTAAAIAEETERLNGTIRDLEHQLMGK